MGGRKDICGGRIGTSFEARRWLSLDPCGFLGVMLSFSVHLFAFGVVACHLIAGFLISTAVFLLMYTPCVLLALASLYMAWTTNPGSVEMGARPLVTVKRASSGEIIPSEARRNRGLRRCPKCSDNFKPNRAHHDSVTGRCIVKFDHFCPWVGNAVGAMNHKFFVLFVGYTMMSCLFALCLIGLRAFHCGIPMPSASASTSPTSGDGQDTNRDYPHECTGWNESYASLLLSIISAVFFIFTCCMFVEQIEAIKTNASKIARMKMRVGQAGTELSRVTEEFNEMFGGDSNQAAWHWFLPLPVEFPPGMKKVVLGYEWDETFDAVPYQEPNNGDLELGTATTIGGRIELTAARARANGSAMLSTNKEKSSEHDGADDLPSAGVGDAPFTATPAATERPKLIKRNSREHEASSREQQLKQGTLT